MWSAQMDAEREYRAKLEAAVNNPQDENMHPIRRRAINSANSLKG